MLFVKTTLASTPKLLLASLSLRKKKRILINKMKVFKTTKQQPPLEKKRKLPITTHSLFFLETKQKKGYVVYSLPRVAILAKKKRVRLRPSKEMLPLLMSKGFANLVCFTTTFFLLFFNKASAAKGIHFPWRLVNTSFPLASCISVLFFSSQ